MSDDKTSFGLGNLTDGMSKRAEELAHDDSAKVKSRDDIARTSEGPMKPFTFQQEDYDRTEAPKDEMRKYWRQYETTPLLRNSISSFADQVTEPGYYIQAQGLDENTLKQLDHWLQKCSIIEGEPGKDFRLLAKKATIQREVRGTSLIEKAPDKEDEEKVAALKLINPETMEAVTRPGQSILLEQDDIDQFDDAPEAESGGAAAYLQDLSETNTFFGRPVSSDADKDYKVGFTRDEIIKLTRDADVGEVFGTSRIEAVADRVEGIKKKLSDNDEAISSKAYPLWLFYFGGDDDPIWDSSDINEFMNAHEMDQFHPGMKQGVRGDVSVETISGEVADIAESLQFDIDWIMSAMPMPKYALGAFDSQVGQIGGIAQQQDVNRQIKEARRELEEEFSPLLREVAQQFGVDESAADDIYLRIGSPGEPEPEVPRRENVIRYVPKDQRDPQSSGGQTVDDGQVDGQGEGEDQDTEERPPHEPEPVENPLDADTPGFENEADAPETAGAQVWHDSRGLEELSLNAGDEQSRLADEVFNTLVRAREEALDQVEHQFGDTPIYAVTNFENVANSVVRSQMSRGRFRDRVKPIVKDSIRSVEESLSGQSARFAQSQSVRFHVQDIENATENALEEMMRLMRINIRRSVTNNEEWSSVRRRTENEYNDASLRQRAELIAHMEMRDTVETTKLQVWESSDDVIGVRVTNDDPSTPLTESLDGATAYFDEGDIADQLMEQTRDQFLHSGFDPLPPTPPYHYQGSSTLEPITEDN